MENKHAESTVDPYHGNCPICHGSAGHIDAKVPDDAPRTGDPELDDLPPPLVSRTWFYCRTHKLRWRYKEGYLPDLNPNRSAKECAAFMRDYTAIGADEAWTAPSDIAESLLGDVDSAEEQALERQALLTVGWEGIDAAQNEAIIPDTESKGTGSRVFAIDEQRYRAGLRRRITEKRAEKNAVTKKEGDPNHGGAP